MKNQRNDMSTFDMVDANPAMSLQTVLLILLGAGVGALFGAVILPIWVPALSSSLTGAQPKAFWYLSRASGFVAYGLIWLSVVLGLLITNKLARIWPGGPLAADVHQFASLLGLGFALFHGMILLGDHYINYTLPQLLIPFAGTAYRPLWVGFGQLGFYLALPIAFSFYARKSIGYRTWRLIHYASFAFFLLAIVHAVYSGTDTGSFLVNAFYSVTGGSVLFLTIYRVLMAGVSRAEPGAARRA